MENVICPCCGQECNPINVDFGVGHYECHGWRGIDIDVQTVSDCCEAPLDADTCERLMMPYIDD